MINSAISSRGWLSVPVMTQVVLCEAGIADFRLRFSLSKRKPAFAQSFDQSAIVRLVKKFVNALPDHFADVRDSLQLFDGSFHRRASTIREMIGERARRAHADVQNSEAE